MPKTDTDLLISMYGFMYITRRSEERLVELYRQGIVKGTVTTGEGNEAAIVGAATALDPKTDICNFMQRDFAGYLIWGISLYHLFSHYVANSDSYTQGKDGNVHHGVPEKGLLPMVSHLGAMIPNVVGAVFARRQQGVNAVGLAIIGDGGTSTGDVHEALNIASVLDVPIILFIENNQWAYSTPNSLQFNGDDLSQRAVGYGIEGSKIDGTNPLTVFSKVKEIVSKIRSSGKPYILQVDTYRLSGHAAYDTADYVSAEELKQGKLNDPLGITRKIILTDTAEDETSLKNREEEWDSVVSEEANKSLAANKLNPLEVNWSPYSQFSPPDFLPPYSGDNLTPVQAVNEALGHVLLNDKDVFILGEDIGIFGGPFKATKGLFEKYGRSRVIDMPLAESGFTGFALGAAEMGLRPVVEMQFSDFSTDAVTQIGVNAGSYYFRTGLGVPITIRMPGGGGLSYGPFHSQDLEGLFGTFPGLKIVYPSFVEDYFHLLIASIYDNNPVLFFENKFLQRRLKGDVRFDGSVQELKTARVCKTGEDLTVVSYGAMLHEVFDAVETSEKTLNVSIEVIDPRVLKPFDLETVAESVQKTHRLLVVHESWAACGVGGWIVSELMEKVFFDLDAPPLVYAPPDTPVPFAPELERVYRPDKEGILKKIGQLLEY